MQYVHRMRLMSLVCP